MAQSKATTPHFYLQAEIDMTAVMESREQLKAAGHDGYSAPTINDIVLRACGIALRETPRANATYRDGTIELHPRVNIGLAVAANHGLLVPTIFDADHKGLREIAAETRRLAGRVRATGA
jgi:pyruvate dehydrogenase E2 component (dihydrolipoamide acetyltransferase)